MTTSFDTLTCQEWLFWINRLSVFDVNLPLHLDDKHDWFRCSMEGVAALLGMPNVDFPLDDIFVFMPERAEARLPDHLARDSQDQARL